jgi:PBP1b-binding outer membrane lipoprotein LpoB
MGKVRKMKKFAFLAMLLGSMFLYGCAGDTKKKEEPKTDKPAATEGDKKTDATVPAADEKKADTPAPAGETK